MRLPVVLGALCWIAYGQNCTGGIELVSRITDGASSITGIADLRAALTVRQVVEATTELVIPFENGMPSAVADGRGAFTLKLANPLAGGQHLRIYQASDTGISCIDVLVIAPDELGRLRFYFTGGEVLARETGFQSDSTLFLAFNVDKSWKWGGKLVIDATNNSYRWAPGVGNRVLWNTFFETRLTSVPEAQTSTGSSFTTFIGSRKSASMQAGNYFPILINHWSARGAQNSMFIAPLATVGFIAPVSVSDSTPVNPAQFYNAYGYGARLGHFKLAESDNFAPELLSYLDVICGRFSNLETLVPVTGGTRPYRQYRIAAEGVWKIPTTPFQMGFSANIGQNLLGAPRTLAAVDDLRFFFGVRFDAAKLLGQFQQIK